MQKQYIFKDEYKIKFETIVNKLLELETVLLKNTSWTNSDTL